MAACYSDIYLNSKMIRQPVLLSVQNGCLYNKKYEYSVFPHADIRVDCNCDTSRFSTYTNIDHWKPQASGRELTESDMLDSWTREKQAHTGIVIMIVLLNYN